MTSPNLLVILADDQRADAVRYMPNLRRRLVAPGRTFSACRCNVGLCQSTRVSLLTGQWAHHHKVLNNTANEPGGLYSGPFNHNATLAAWLSDAGYRCGLIGKYLNVDPGFKPAGWETWLQIAAEATTVGDPTAYGVLEGSNPTITRPGVFQTEWLTARALEFTSNPDPRPWFCLVTPTAPHQPSNPHPSDLLAWSDVEWPLDLEDEGVADKPAWVASRPPVSATTRAEIRGMARGILRELNALDRLVRDLIGGLPPSVLSNTIVIYGSDNGLSMGQHRSPAVWKNEPYDSSLLVPLVIRGPGFPAGVSSEPVSMAADLTATCLAAAGVQRTGLDGVDLAQVVQNPAAFKTRALLHAHGDLPADLYDNNIPPGVGITMGGDGVSTFTRKLWRWDIRPTDPPSSRYEAYDIAHPTAPDPLELRNWANDPARLAERNALELTMDALLNAP